VIRFSAALVAVAIGVLIGGVVASELLLVYIAIALSAVALVALAAGVMLKRGELFGEGQGLAPAQAGASPGLPGRSGEVPDRVAPPPLQEAAVGPGAAFAAHGGPAPQPASAQSVLPPSAATREPRPGHDSWRTSPAAAPIPGTWQAPAAFGAAPGWGTSAPSVFAPRTADTAASGQATAAPSWFNPADRAPGAEAPATTRVPASKAGWSWLDGETASPDAAPHDPAPHDPVPHDDSAPSAAGQPEDAAAPDDDWPARYSWLDDEPEEDGGDSDGGSPADAGADGDGATAADGAPAPAALTGASAHPADAASASVTGEPSGGSDPGDAADDRPSWPSPAGTLTVAAPATAAPTTAAPADPVLPDPVLPETVLPGAEAAESVATETAESPTPHPVRDPASGTEAAAAAAEPEGEPPAGATGDSTGLVSVVRGVPRFHREDCVLIRFMPESDTQQMPVAQAREAGCTPCTACEPEG
jgi:hypothetical protein